MVNKILKVICSAVLFGTAGYGIAFITWCYRIHTMNILYPRLMNPSYITKYYLVVGILLLVAFVAWLFIVFSKGNRIWLQLIAVIVTVACCFIWWKAVSICAIFSCYESYTEDIDNYLQTDYYGLDEELSKFFPPKETIDQYADNNVNLDYEYLHFTVMFDERHEYSTVLEMDFSENAPLFEEYTNSIVSESEYEIITDGETTTIVVKDEEDIIVSERVGILYTIVIDSELLTVTYSAKQEFIGYTY